MTRIVVQRNANTYNSSQGRQSSSAPPSTSTSVPSSANSSTSSHAPTHLPAGPPCVSGPEGDYSGEDDSNHELSNRLTASTERHQTQSDAQECFFHHSVPEDAWDGRREGERLTQLPSFPTAAEFSEGAGILGGDESEKEKELPEDGRSPSFSTGDEIHASSACEDVAGVQSKIADDLLVGRCRDDETSASHGIQNRISSTSAQQSPPSSSWPASGAPIPLPFHTSYDVASFREPDQARSNSFQGPHEAVGCSYLYTSSPTPPLSSSGSRRGSWLGSSGSTAPHRGGVSRRGSRVGKPLRNSPNSSRPSSPRSYGEGDGYNSADEQNCRSSGSTGYENNEEREHQFEVEIRNSENLELRRMAEDGNCLFRAVADQVYGDAEMYDETRQMCIDYMEKERDHFAQFVTESFTAYCKRKRRDKVYGNNLEIQAMAEMYNRPIHIYSYSLEPINIFHGSYETDLPPIRLSYHRGNHYNSLMDPGRPAVGAGLGFGSLRGRNVDREQVKAALKAQQDQQIDKALLAEGRFYSDIELTEQEIQRMVMEASRAEYFEEEKHRHYTPWSEETSTSAAAEPSSSGTTAGSPKSAVRTMSLAATSTTPADSIGLTPNVRMLMSMGFSYVEVLEACSIFGDDVNNMLCYLLETDGGTSGDGESMYRKKGKAAER